MMRKVKTVLFFLTIFSISIANAQLIKIGLYTKSNIKSVIFTINSGKYQIYADSMHVIPIWGKKIINFSLKGNLIEIKTLNKKLGEFRNIEIQGIGDNNTFKVQSLIPKYRERLYDDDLILRVKNGRIQLINHVDLENYIAGVVESEGGSKSSLEYYKTQAIITRAYALRNFYRHISEGFNLCSTVHCQAYHHKATKSDKILKAVKMTRGLVIVDTTLNLINAAFHSNSGGQTSSSEMIWLTPKSYLKSIVDTFSTKRSNAVWTKKIPLWKWKTYLKNNGFIIPPTTKPTDFNFEQKQRKTFYVFNNDSMLLKDIRTDFKLRSTFFSVKAEGNVIVLHGKGYGHGVGLSQQGAMEMAMENYNYREIIKFYYKNVFIVSLRALNFFKE